MFHRVRLPLLLLALALPLRALPDAQLVRGEGSASATVRLRVVIPPIVRVLGNQHPGSVSLADAAGRQDLEVLTTMRQGFCAALRLNTTGVRDWSLQSDNPAVQVQRTGDGYRVCAPRNGHYRVALEHRFELDVPVSMGSGARLPWPVLTELNAL